MSRLFRNGAPSFTITKVMTPRKCLACHRTFESEGPHHRLCPKHRAQSGEEDYSIGRAV